MPSGNWHLQPFLHPHLQPVYAGHCCGQDGAHSFVESGSERRAVGHTPALSSGEVAEAMLWLPLPTHHPFDLHSRPDVPRGSHQLCKIHPAVQEPSSQSHFLSRTQRDPHAGTAGIILTHSRSVCFLWRGAREQEESDLVPAFLS